MFPPYEGAAVVDDPKNKRPCDWHYVFDVRGDGCWTFDAWVVPGSAGPNVECGDCRWQLVYCEKEAAGNTKGNDYMILTTNDHYKNEDAKMKGLCGNGNNDPSDDDDITLCSDAMYYDDPGTITAKCRDGDHQGNGN